MRVLLIEDEDRIASFLDKALRAQGYEVDRARTGEEGLARAMAATPNDGGDAADVILLDLGLPDVDGLDVLRSLRAAGITTPVVALTARAEVADRVAGLELGADDYLPKPFDLDELVARIRARTRAHEVSTELASDGVRLDLLTRRARRGEREVDLTEREARLLEAFVRNPGRVLPREELLLKVWGIGFDPRSNLVDVYVGYLRRKLGQDVVQTVRLEGYRLGSAGSPRP